MKNYITNNPYFIKEYIVENNNIIIIYGDDSIKIIDNNEFNVNNLDRLMNEQFNSYEHKQLKSLSTLDLMISLGFGGIVGVSGVSESASFNDFIPESLFLITASTMLSMSFIAALKSNKAYDDYRKDKIFMNYIDEVDKCLSNDDLYGNLPSNVREKVKQIHDGNANLCLNSINNMKANDLETIVSTATGKQKALIRRGI